MQQNVDFYIIGLCIAQRLQQLTKRKKRLDNAVNIIIRARCGL